jgi:hypothetical protein
METSLDIRVKLAAEEVRSADALLITAGAGMGVDSGLPDFRGTQGFWRAYPAIAKLGLSFQQMANRSARVVVIELGAGSAIPTVRHTSERVVERLDGRLIRINPREDHAPSGHIGLPLSAAEGIRQIFDYASAREQAIAEGGDITPPPFAKILCRLTSCQGSRPWRPWRRGTSPRAWRRS